MLLEFQKQTQLLLKPIKTEEVTLFERFLQLKI